MGWKGLEMESEAKKTRTKLKNRILRTQRKESQDHWIIQDLNLTGHVAESVVTV